MEIVMPGNQAIGDGVADVGGCPKVDCHNMKKIARLYEQDADTVRVG